MTTNLQRNVTAYVVGLLRDVYAINAAPSIQREIAEVVGRYVEGDIAARPAAPVTHVYHAETPSATITNGVEVERLRRVVRSLEAELKAADVINARNTNQLRKVAGVAREMAEVGARFITTIKAQGIQDETVV